MDKGPTNYHLCACENMVSCLEKGWVVHFECITSIDCCYNILWILMVLMLATDLDASSLVGVSPNITLFFIAIREKMTQCKS